MKVKELYKELKKLRDAGKIGNAYGGSEAAEVLGELYDYIIERYETSMPPWVEAFFQIFSWQFQTLHEDAQTYYENQYGASDYKSIFRVADFLRDNGYQEIAEPYAAAAVDCGYLYPEDMVHLLPDDWIVENEETIWNFYVDLLEKHRAELIGEME